MCNDEEFERRLEFTNMLYLYQNTTDEQEKQTLVEALKPLYIGVLSD